MENAVHTLTAPTLLEATLVHVLKLKDMAATDSTAQVSLHEKYKSIPEVNSRQGSRRRPPFWNHLNGNNSAASELVRIKFDKLKYPMKVQQINSI